MYREQYYKKLKLKKLYKETKNDWFAGAYLFTRDGKTYIKRYWLSKHSSALKFFKNYANKKVRQYKGKNIDSLPNNYKRAYNVWNNVF